MRVLATTVSTLPSRLLASLPQDEWDVLRHDLRRARMPRGQVLLAQGRSEQAFFVEDGLVSVMAGAGGAGGQGRGGVQVAMVGNEGLVGAPAAPGGAAVAVLAVAQFPGSVLAMPAATLAERMGEMPGLRRACLCCLQAFVVQVMEWSASNARDSVLRRCVRWLLMADERTGGAELPVTHGALALLLGVRRPGVSLAMAVLHGRELIQTRRGAIRLLDRPGLRALGHDRSRLAARRTP